MATINDIPTEIVDHIAQYMSPEDLSCFMKLQRVIRVQSQYAATKSLKPLLAHQFQKMNGARWLEYCAPPDGILSVMTCKDTLTKLKTLAQDEFHHGHTHAIEAINFMLTHFTCPVPFIYPPSRNAQTAVTTAELSGLVQDVLKALPMLTHVNIQNGDPDFTRGLFSLDRIGFGVETAEHFAHSGCRNRRRRDPQHYANDLSTFFGVFVEQIAGFPNITSLSMSEEVACKYRTSMDANKPLRLNSVLVQKLNANVGALQNITVLSVEYATHERAGSMGDRDFLEEFFKHLPNLDTLALAIMHQRYNVTSRYDYNTIGTGWRPATVACESSPLDIPLGKAPKLKTLRILGGAGRFCLSVPELAVAIPSLNLEQLEVLELSFFNVEISRWRIFLTALGEMAKPSKSIRFVVPRADEDFVCFRPYKGTEKQRYNPDREDDSDEADLGDYEHVYSPEDSVRSLFASPISGMKGFKKCFEHEFPVNRGAMQTLLDNIHICNVGPWTMNLPLTWAGRWQCEEVGGTSSVGLQSNAVC